MQAGQIMTEQLVPRPIDQGLVELEKETRSFLDASLSVSTRRAYQSDWRHFVSWCGERGLQTLPATPKTVALYATELARSCSVATIERRLAAISQAHQAAGGDSPTQTLGVRKLMQGIRREKGTAQDTVAPITLDVLRRMVWTLPDGLLGIRDRALLLVGFAGALRRSELVSIGVGDLAFVEQGVIITLRRSKTDQEAAGREVGVPRGTTEFCPVAALESWLEQSGITEGAVFRRVDRHGRLGDQQLSNRAVAIVIKRAAERVGLEPKDYSGHSLRAGFATTAAAMGVSERAIMDQTGHRSVMTARKYIRHGSIWRENAAAMIGL